MVVAELVIFILIVLVVRGYGCCLFCDYINSSCSFFLIQQHHLLQV